MKIPAFESYPLEVRRRTEDEGRGFLVTWPDLAAHAGCVQLEIGSEFHLTSTPFREVLPRLSGKSQSYPRLLDR